MKASIRAVSLFLPVVFLSACATTASPIPEVPAAPTTTVKKPESGKPPLSEAGIYILPDRAFRVDRLSDALDSVFAVNTGIDNLIVYVHGRACGGGGEPKKSLNEVMPELEGNYTAKALMFYWPGSDDECPLGFPEDKAKNAAPMLAKVLQQLQQYKKDNPDKLRNMKLTLLFHSMGNVVFEALLRSYPEKSLSADLFDTTVLNSSATASKGHDEWLKKVDFSPHLYVTVNNHDKVVGAAGMSQHGTRLGKSLEAGFGDRPVKLVANAIYVDVSDTGVNHRYFIRSGQERNPYLRQFYEAVMNGRTFDFAGFEGVGKVERRDGATVVFMKNTPGAR